MIVFWLVCATFVAIALAFVIPPLLQRAGTKPESEANEARKTRETREANVAVYRDQISELEADLANGIISQEQYQQDRDEIERRVLEDVNPAGAEGPTNNVSGKKTRVAVTTRGPVYAVALGVPLVAVALYMRVGNPAAVSGLTTATPQAPFAGGPSQSGQMTQQRMEANVAALAKRLQQNPRDVQGWMMLGRSYLTLEKYGEASQAYAKATALKPDDADLWADYAFAMAMANGQKLQGPPLELVNKALKLDPENAKALELAGSAAFEAKNYKAAISYWQRLRQRTPPDSELAQTLSQRINEAKSLAGTAK
jgi:cytochrome c-type biogenesis protein CcmH